MQRVNVPIPGRSYDVTIGTDVIARAGEHLPELPASRRAFVVGDRTVTDTWLGPLSEGLAARGLTTVLLAVPAGEQAKTLQVHGALLHQLATQQAHRDDLVVALGGGAVGDLAGFVAATYMRGVPLIQVPTTLTAQVDAAIGGKTAVNLPEGKNLVGAFYQPSAVLADVDALATLPERDLRSGLAEVAKYGLTLDPDLLALLETRLDAVLAREPDVMEDLVTRCVRAKARTVAQDERDSGARLILNYGHTLGHALERLGSFEGRTHGEAIAIGMVFAARLAEELEIASEGLVGRHVRLLTSLGLEAEGALPAVEEIMDAFRLDKKFQDGIRFVLLRDIDQPEIVDGVSEDRIRATLTRMGAAA
ncbi:MAG: 3-dehydroquinate synthase [Actinomycetota bacterium]